MVPWVTETNTRGLGVGRAWGSFRAARHTLSGLFNMLGLARGGRGTCDFYRKCHLSCRADKTDFRMTRDLVIEGSTIAGRWGCMCLT